MAQKFWVGGGSSASWGATGNTNWGTASNIRDNASVPTAADDVIFDNSAYGASPCTIDGTPVCRSIDTTAYTNTITHTAAITLTIGDGTAGVGNVALAFGTFTYTLGSATTSAIAFVSTSATVQTVNFNGKTTGNVTFNAASNGSWQYTGAHTAGQVTFTKGTLNTNGQTCSWLSFYTDNSNTRTLTLGSSAIALSETSATYAVRALTTTNLTVTANTAVITIANGGWFAGNRDWNGLSLVFTSGASDTLTGGIFKDVTRTGASTKTGALSLQGNVTCTGTFTCTGASAVNRLLVSSNTLGTLRTITAAAVSLTNVDFMDITGAGAATWTGTSLGDCGGNSGITFDASVQQTHTASAGGNWSDVTKWTSRVPLPQDDVVVDANTTGTLVMDMPRACRDLTCTGFTGTLSIAPTVAGYIYGSLALGSGMSLSQSQTFLLAGRGSHTIRSNAKAIPLSTAQAGPGGTYTLLDSLTITAGGAGWGVSAGTFNAAGYNVTAPVFTSTGVLTRVINMGAGTWTLTSTSTASVWNVLNTGSTINCSTSTIVISAASTNTRTFVGAGFTYGTLTYTVANSPGALAIAGANTFTNLNVGSGRTLTMPASTTQTVTGDFNVQGVDNGYLRLPGVAANYASTPDSAALSITGDIDIRCKVALDDWTPAAVVALVSKFNTSTTRSYELYLNTAGTLVLVWSTDGTAQTAKTSTAATGVSDGSVKWVRATLDVDNGSAQNVVKFYTSDDGSSWTQLGTTVTTAGTTSIADTTTVLEIGSDHVGASSPATGKFYRAQIRNNIADDGTGIQFDADFTTKPFGANTFTEGSANAATVTINGALAQVGDGRVSLVSSTPGTAATLSKAA